MPASKLSANTEFEGTPIEMAAEIRRMAEEQKALRNVFFSQFTSRIFEQFPNLNRVIIQGYTPGFNDGDPCVHSHEVAVNVRGFASIDEEEPGIRYVDHDENPNLDWDDRYVLDPEAPGCNVASFNPDLTPEEVQAIRHAFEAFNEAIVDIYNTNFTLTWLRDEDGKVQFSHEHYDCGY